MSRIVLNRKDFVKALQIGGAFAGRAKALPILDCVKISVKGGKGRIVSSDFENTISKSFECIECDAEATFCIRCKDLMSYVKLISGDTFTIEIAESGKSANILHSKGNAEYPLEDWKQFPQVKPSDEVKEFILPAALLNNWIVDGQVFVANDELRPTMNGIYFYNEASEMGFCATDGHFLVTDNIVSENMDNWSFILPKSAFSVLCNAISDTENVNIRLSDNNVLFIGNGVSLMSRTTEGRFPNFKSVLPSSHKYSAKLSKKDVLEALGRCLLTVNPASNLVKLDLINDSITFTSQDIDFATKNTEKIACESNGEMKIGFNAKKMVSCLGAIQGDNVEILLTSPDRPAIFKDSERENFSALLMPMMLND